MTRYLKASVLLERIVRARSAALAIWWLSFLDGAILPIPIEAVLAPYMQMRRDRIWWIAVVAITGFLAAALLGYAIGAVFFDSLGAPLLARMGWEQPFAEAQDFLRRHGFVALLALAVLPVPVQVGMIGAGALGYPALLVALAVFLPRAVRFFGLGLLVFLYGDRVVAWFRLRGRTSGGRPPDLRPAPASAAMVRSAGEDRRRAI